MKLAIMQPYLFPYIGYFQLINAVDRFVVHDDVQFIKGGWINRNRFLLKGQIQLFTVPLADASSHALIRDRTIHKEKYHTFKSRFGRRLTEAYRKAPFFSPVFELVQFVLDGECESMGRLATDGLRSVCRYLGIDTRFVDSSSVYRNSHLGAQGRVLDICHREGADVYINPPGGTELYQKDAFANSGVELHFLNPKPISYHQYDGEFVPWLSIIDVLMFNSVGQVKAMLNEYELV